MSELVNRNDLILYFQELFPNAAITVANFAGMDMYGMYSASIIVNAQFTIPCLAYRQITPDGHSNALLVFVDYKQSEKLRWVNI